MLIVFTDAVIVLMLFNVALLLASRGPLGEWYGYWAEVVIILYSIAGITYIAAVVIFIGIVIRTESRLAESAAWIVTGICFGYLAIPIYLGMRRPSHHD